MGRVMSKKSEGEDFPSYFGHQGDRAPWLGGESAGQFGEAASSDSVSGGALSGDALSADALSADALSGGAATAGAPESAWPVYDPDDPYAPDGFASAPDAAGSPGADYSDAYAYGLAESERYGKPADPEPNFDESTYADATPGHPSYANPNYANPGYGAPQHGVVQSGLTPYQSYSGTPRKQKSMAAGITLSVLFGPFGVFYTSPKLALMAIVAFVVNSAADWGASGALWVMCIVINGVLVHRHNQRNG